MKYISANRILQKDNIFLLIPLFLYLPFIFWGYGPDSDTYEVLRTGTLLSGILITFRRAAQVTLSLKYLLFSRIALGEALQRT